MAEAEPGGSLGSIEPELRGVQWAVSHTGLGRRTLQRRVDAWLEGQRDPYAIKSGRRNSWRGDRLVDPVDAERVRLQEKGRLSPDVTAARWREMITDRDIPWLYVTEEPWFREIVGWPPKG